jgi:hypothetical protein
VIPQDAPREMKTMARIARVNVCPIVVDSLAQSLFVDGFRANDAPTNDSPSGRSGRRTRWTPARPAIHRAAFAYGAAYAVVLPGDPYPVIRPVSPRR